MITIVVADDHTIFRQGLVGLLQSEDAFRIIGECGDGRAAMMQIMDEKPDVAILDISMPEINGLDIAAEIKKHRLPTRVIILTMHREVRLARSALEYGVNGYLLKDDAFEDLIAAIKTVADGREFISIAMNGENLKDPFSNSTLTRREKEILTHIARGGSNRQIAETLCISPKTVDTHRTNIMRKLDAHSVAELVDYAIKLGLQ